MPRKLLSLGNDAVRYLIGVDVLRDNSSWALLSLGPAPELCVCASCARLGFGARLATFCADQRSDINFVSTMRAFHPANLLN